MLFFNITFTACLGTMWSSGDNFQYSILLPRGSNSGRQAWWQMAFYQLSRLSHVLLLYFKAFICQLGSTQNKQKQKQKSRKPCKVVQELPDLYCVSSLLLYNLSLGRWSVGHTDTVDSILLQTGTEECKTPPPSN